MYIIFRTFVTGHNTSITFYDTMKIRISTLAGIIAALLMTTDLFGQAQITTKKEKIKDFASRTTKIVLSGDELLDDVLQDCISGSWNVSPYEFCSMAEFEALKSNPGFYFLMVVKGQFRKEKEPGIDMITLIKGGEGADKSVNDMIELATFPLRASEEPTGREFLMLPVIIRQIQDKAIGMTQSELKAYSGGFTVSPKVFGKIWNKRIHFSKDDLSPQINASVMKNLDEDIIIEEDEEDVDEIFEAGTYNAVVSYIVAPTEPKDGSICYKMLIGADTHELYYFKKHKISASKGAGFLASDMKAISKVRKKKK